MSWDMAKSSLIGLFTNISSRLYAGAIGIAVTPLYVEILGFANYGLVGIFAIVMTAALLLDLGLSATVTRELARITIMSGSGDEMVELVRTTEILYWIMSLICGVAIWLLAPTLSQVWINSKELSDEEVTLALRLMGATVALQLPLALYSGTLIGLGRLSLLSSLVAVRVTVRDVGVLLAFAIFPRTSTTFFFWKMVSEAALVFLMRSATYRSLPIADTRVRFNIYVLARIRGFAAEMTVVSLLLLLLQNVDKMVLVRATSLTEFGIYSLSITFSAVMGVLASATYTSIIAPVTAVMRVVHVTARKRLFTRISDLLCLLVCPIGPIMVVMAGFCLFIITGDSVLADKARWIFALVSLTALINAFTYLPYALLVGAGMAREVIKVYLFGAGFLVPGLIVASLWAGTIGAASMMLAFQIFNLGGLSWAAVNCNLLTRPRRWVAHNILGLNGVVFLLAWLGRDLAETSGRLHGILNILACYLASLVAVSCYLLVLRRRLVLPAIKDLRRRLRA